MFRMTVDEKNKVFFIKAEGFFTKQEANNYRKEFLSKTKKLTPFEYTFLLDGTETKASTMKVAELLKEMMIIFMETPFKKRILIQQKSPVANNQTHRLAREVQGFETFIFVDTMEEALTHIF